MLDHKNGFMENIVNEEERIIGFIPEMKKKTGLFSSTIYTLVVTNTRILFVQLAPARAKEVAQQAIQQAKAEGKGYFHRSMEAMMSRRRIMEVYRSMKPEEILHETRGNFYIENQSIQKVKITSDSGYLDESYKDGKSTMVITTNIEKIKLKTTNLDVKAVKEMLNRGAIST
ncbi:hypothetical protein SAMN05660297_02099 [Natronincola peptidivorans]|uniref:Uncharacterized protein n=1 Tax=Natronincola peptidivorans TaxID=426128 RepID=A0A1I0DP89_9FIRM|nr:hypothetical protein [Natronincola peptidivorans]SET34164.1 hypothetical protein SAMN05660297_02099 [Natronincola peptidivorans]